MNAIAKRALVFGVVGTVALAACGGGGSPSGGGGGEAGSGAASGTGGSTAGTGGGVSGNGGTGGQQPEAGAVGAPCAKNGDCNSGVCQTNGHCTAPCTGVGDCPAGPAWSCAPMTGHGLQCQCQVSGETCDGFDQDCDSIADDGATCAQAGYVCQGGSCKCVLECDGKCIDGQSDEANCGSCGNACAQGASCNGGSCQCPGGTPDVCNGKCLSKATDIANCGSCGNACAQGASCNGGSCQCPGGTTDVCGGECVDKNTDPSNCGSCGNACALWAGCYGGSCQCPSGTPDVCTGVCVSKATDIANCGGCGSVCAVAGASCVGGSCQCPSGTPDVCNGKCVSKATDIANCGSCGNACALGASCNGGSCQCGALEQIQAGLCVAKVVTVTGGYGIDATEVTRAQYETWLNGSPNTSGQPSYCSWNTSYAPSCEWPPGAKGGHPVVCVEWCDAYAYCAGVGKRLCGKIGGGANSYGDYADATKSQWFNACTSGGQNDYPYGDTYASATCNAGSTTAPVASMPGCQSSATGYEGVYDLSGNVWEWEDSCVGTGQWDNCRLRGGSFGNYDSFLRCDYGLYTGRPASDVSFGFRCCAL